MGIHRLLREGKTSLNVCQAKKWIESRLGMDDCGVYGLAFKEKRGETGKSFSGRKRSVEGCDTSKGRLHNTICVVWVRTSMYKLMGDGGTRYIALNCNGTKHCSH